MSISRTKFVIFFVIAAFVFMFATNALFGTEAQVFTQPPESWLGAEPAVAWKNTGYNALLFIKAVLIGPMLFTGSFLREDPPPPFVALVFALYWSLLALILHYLLSRRNRL